MNPVCSADLATLLVILQAQDFYVEMKWEFTSWGKRADMGLSGPQGFCACCSPAWRTPPSHCSHCGASSFSSQLSATGEAFPNCLRHCLSSVTIISFTL